MNRRQRRSEKPVQKFASDIVKSANIAFKQGDCLRALDLYASAVSKEPDNHDYKVRLCYLLRNISFKSFNPKLKGIIFNCLETSGIDHQNLFKPWFSLLMCDPNFKPFQNLINNQEFSSKKLKKNIKDFYFLAGLNCLVVYDTCFERALLKIKNEIIDDSAEFLPFVKSFETYCLHTEYVFCDKPKIKEKSRVDKTIRSLGASQNLISLRVRSQYEENPYPRWTSINVQEAPKSHAKGHDHLIAGCGTGYGACATAMLYPSSKITAIDLSLSSLSYAMEKAKALKLTNIEFYQADILNLNDLNQNFDVIECSGVLHHMQSPEEGWSALMGKLKQNGRMHIGLYSEIGRRDVVAARELIEQHGFKPTHDGIKKAREEIAGLPDGHAAFPVTNRRDFYSISSCRDLLFHIQEHRFSIAQFSKVLDKLGLIFEGFDIHNPDTVKNYRTKFPHDLNMRNLVNWELFELENPNTFRGMYQFWCHTN